MHTEKLPQVQVLPAASYAATAATGAASLLMDRTVQFKNLRALQTMGFT